MQLSIGFRVDEEEWERVSRGIEGIDEEVEVAKVMVEED